MTLVTQNLGATAPAGAKKAFGDALVEQGTIQLVDFSNGGTLIGGSVANGKPVNNLAALSAKEYGFLGHGAVVGSGMALTPGKGFDATGGAAGGGQGAFFSGSILNYLKANESDHKYLLVFWIRAKQADFVAGGIFRSLNGSTVTYNDVRANISAIKTISPTFGGGGNGTVAINASDGKAIQVGITFKMGQAPEIFKDGIFLNNGTISATGFSGIANQIGIGKVETGPAPTAPVYRWLIEDLTVTGRSAEEVVRKDYDYSHAIGQFQGIQKRPWIDNY